MTQSSTKTIIITTGLTKAVGLSNQAIFTYVVAKSNGSSGLQSIFIAISFVSWFSLLLGGMQASLPAIIIYNNATSLVSKQYITIAFLLSAIFAILAYVINDLLIYSLNFPAYASLITVAAICNSLLITVCLSEQIFQVFGRFVIFNLLSTIGSVISLCGTIAVAYLKCTLEWFIIFYYSSVLFPTLAAFILIIFYDGIYFLSPRLFVKQGIDLIKVGLYSLGFAIYVYITSQAPIIVFGAMKRENDILTFGAIVKFVTILISGIGAFLPLLFNYAGALSVRDTNGYIRLLDRLMMLSSIGAIFVIATVGNYGSLMFELWSSGTVILNSVEQAFAGIFISTYIILFILLSAIGPNITLSFALRWIFLVAAPAALGLGSLGGFFFGTSGMIAGIVVITIAVIVHKLWFVRRHYKRD